MFERKTPNGTNVRGAESDVADETNARTLRSVRITTTVGGGVIKLAAKSFPIVRNTPKTRRVTRKDCGCLESDRRFGRRTTNVRTISTFCFRQF